MSAPANAPGTWPELIHSFGTTAESWQGTKAQLQAAGIGVGLAFPGESGIKGQVACKCPLGFEVSVCRYDWDPEGVFRASSHYVPEPTEEEEPTPFAPGVTRRRSYWSWEYVGTADALVAAGLARHDQFPGQPGRPKMQVSYRADGQACSSSPHGSTQVRIRKKGKQVFEISVGFNEAECEERKAQREAAKEAHLKACEAVREERRRLRNIAAQVTDDPAEALETFRSEQGEHLDFLLRMVWQFLTKQEGAFSFDLPEGGEEYELVAGAFDQLREVVQTATIVKDGKALALVRNRKRLTAARSDAGLQQFLGDACRLRLVHSEGQS